MINREELEICMQRGHEHVTSDEGWSQCDWCGLWVRERCTLEEREDQPEESHSRPRKRSAKSGEVTPNPEVLQICRRRGHKHLLGSHWSRCDWCGFWVREIRTIEEREEEPPGKEMSLSTQTQRRLKQLRERQRD
jgi:hypothetical protein